MSDAAVLERLKLPKASSDVVINCDVEKIMYGNFLAVRDSTVPIEKGKITGSSAPLVVAKALCCGASTA